jgi:hypothetical protein
MSNQKKPDSKKTMYIVIAVIAVIAVVLTACLVGGLFNSSGNPQATPTPTATATATPTATPSPTPSPTPTPTPTPTPSFNVSIVESDYNETMAQNTTYTATVKITDHTFNQLVTMLVAEQNLNVTETNNSTNTVTGNLTTVLPAVIPQLTSEFGFFANFTISDVTNGQFTITFVSENACTTTGGVPTSLLEQNLAYQLTKIIDTLM